ncbi:MAG: hypothetical protein JWL96_1430 [Sphingomonas bacterium]|uniref:hypothetical protein n=1 Tax=Sphingomonas bacterium TaxID=1895847 RepID=UPI00261536C9|nr:hypothetical protein [Sphingomonas bacterium]MDB5709360.1 hypothetical protein [Sphingomonas bacterium]
MLGWLLLLAADPSAAWLAQERAATRVSPICTAPTDSNEVTVCGRRHADRYRVPLIEIDRDNPANEGVPAERYRLLARTNNCREHNLFQVGCGMAGVTASTRHGITTGGERPLAP